MRFPCGMRVGVRTMLPEVTLSVAAAVAFTVALVPASVALRRDSFVWRALAFGTVAAAVALVTVAVALRWAGVGHPPVFGTFENSLAAAWAIGVGSLLISRSATWRHVWLGTLPWAAGILAWGLRFNTNRIPLTISERSLWVDVHVVVAWLAYFAITALLSVAVVGVLRGVEARAGRDWAWAADLPPRGWADELLVQASAYSFIGFTGVILTGAFYSWLLFGEFWRWDIVEVLGLVVWMVLGLMLHLRLFFGWRGTKLAALSVFVYAGALAMYWGLALFPASSYHYFELPF